MPAEPQERSSPSLFRLQGINSPVDALVATLQAEFQGTQMKPETQLSKHISAVPSHSFCILLAVVARILYRVPGNLESRWLYIPPDT